MLLALLQGYRSGVKGSIPGVPFRSRQGDLVKPNGIFVTFQESKGDPQIECDRIDELGDFLHTNNYQNTCILASSKVFSWLKFEILAIKDPTMLKKQKTLVCIHPCEPMGVKPRGLTQEFYEMCKTKLNPGGILVTQAKGWAGPRMMIG